MLFNLMNQVYNLSKLLSTITEKKVKKDTNRENVAVINIYYKYTLFMY